MIELTKLIPCGMNSKLVIRHSIRNSLKESEFPDEVSLTNDGISKAFDFGKNLNIQIGDVYTSNVLRCIQTVKCIIEGADDLRNHPVSLIDMRQFYTDNIQQSFKTFISEKNGKNVAAKLSKEIPIPGFYPIRDIALNQLKFIFSTGGKPSCIDIYCTHDFQLICLISALFKNIQNIEDINSNWPQMLEGVLIWGNINDFYCVWRNNICHIVDLEF